MKKLNSSVLMEYPIWVKDVVKVQDDVYKIDSDMGLMCLKRTDRNKEKVIFIYSVLEHLVKSGFTKVSPPVLAKDGSPFVISGHDIYFMTKWISGITCDFKRSHHLAAAAQTLGEFHLVSHGVHVLPGGRARAMYRRWPDTFKERTGDLKRFAAETQEKSKKNDFEKRFLKSADFLIDQAEKAVRMLSDSPYQKLAERAEKMETFTHRDVADRNFIITREGEAYLIDFDYCRYDLRLTDVVRLVERTLKDMEWRSVKADFIIREYNKAAPLTKEEYKVMLAFLQFPQKVWRVCDRYFNRKKNWQQEGFEKKLKLGLRNAAMKERFIADFEMKYCQY